MATQAAAGHYTLDRMTHADLDEVARIERRSFSSPWPMAAYRRELRRSDANTYLVLRVDPGAGDDGGGLLSHLPFAGLRRREGGDGRRIAGFAGMWQSFDEAHVTTIAVDPDLRGRGLGEVLFVALVAEATRRGTTWLSLEVRESNRVAQRLYEKYGLAASDRKRGYYTNDGEDALVMWSHSLKDPAYVRHLSGLRDDLQRRVGEAVAVPRLTGVGWQAEGAGPGPSYGGPSYGGPPDGGR